MLVLVFELACKVDDPSSEAPKTLFEFFESYSKSESSTFSTTVFTAYTLILPVTSSMSTLTSSLVFSKLPSSSKSATSIPASSASFLPFLFIVIFICMIYANYNIQIKRMSY